MSTNESDGSTLANQTPDVSPGNYSPVTVDMKDTMGAIFLGVVACFTLIGWMRAEARNRALMKQMQPA